MIYYKAINEGLNRRKSRELIDKFGEYKTVFLEEHESLENDKIKDDKFAS